MKKLSKILVAVLVLAMAISAVACTNSGTTTPTDPPAATDGGTDNPATNPPAASGGKVTLRVNVVGAELEDNISATTGQEREGYYTRINRDFVPNHDGLTVELINIPWENCWAKQRTMMSSGEVDVLYTGGAMAAPYYKEGLIREIDSFVEATADFNPAEYYIEGLYDSPRVMDYSQSVHVGLPIVAGQRATYQDSKLFEDWGQPLLPAEPTTDDILNAAKAMTGVNPKTGDDNYGLWISTSQTPNGAIYSSLMKAMGAAGYKEGSSLDDLGNFQWDLNTPEVKNGLLWLKEVAPYLHPAVPAGQGNELKGQDGNQVAIYMELIGNTEKSKYLADGDDSWMKRGVLTGGIGPNGSTWTVFDPFIMAKNAQNQEIAWDFMRFWCGYETQAWLYTNYQWAPTVRNTDFIGDWDTYTTFNTAQLPKDEASIVWDEQNDFWITEITKMFWDYVANVCAGISVDEDAILADIQTRAEAWSAALK